MAFSEGLSDTGELTGRGSPIVRGSITGGGTLVGGILHSLPFLIPNYHAALFLAIGVVGFELLLLAYFRYRFFQDTFIRALGIVTFAGIIIAAISAGLGSLLGRPRRLSRRLGTLPVHGFVTRRAPSRTVDANAKALAVTERYGEVRPVTAGSRRARGRPWPRRLLAAARS